MNKTQRDKWINRLIDTVYVHWHWNGHCAHLYTNISPAEEEGDAWEVAVAPALQELAGGPKDGDTVWTPFIFDIGTFIAAPGVQQCNIGVRSLIQDEPPEIVLDILFDNQPVILRILMEPPEGVQPMEVIDINTNRIRCKKEHHD